MTFFTTLETVASIFSAAIFGAIFAILDTILKILSLEFNHILKIKKHVFCAANFFSIPKRDVLENPERKERNKFLGEICAFFKVLTFFIGFILLSYYALDGAIRLYLLLFAIGFFFLFRYASSATILKLTDSLFLFLYLYIKTNLDFF